MYGIPHILHTALNTSLQIAMHTLLHILHTTFQTAMYSKLHTALYNVFHNMPNIDSIPP